MAKNTDRTWSQMRNVQAPSRLFDPVSEVLVGLNREVLWESASLAKAKAGSGKPCCISRDDLLNAVRVVLTRAASEIEKALADDGPRLVKKRAS